MAPSIYEYANVKDWQTAMAEWCAENEPKEPRYRVAWICGEQQGREYFNTEGERRVWLARHPHYTITRCDREEQFNVRPAPKYAAPGAEDHLDGGSASDYRAAGFNRF